MNNAVCSDPGKKLDSALNELFLSEELDLADFIGRWFTGDEERKNRLRVKLSERAFGPTSIEYADASLDLAIFLFGKSTEDWPEARHFIDAGLVAARLASFEDQALLASVFLPAGILLSALDQDRAAEAVFREVLAAELPLELRANARTALANLLLRRHRAAEALPLFEKNYHDLEGHYGAGAAQLSDPLLGMARSLVSLGAVEEAERPFQSALRIDIEHLGHLDPKYGRRVREFAEYLAKRGDREMAARSLEGYATNLRIAKGEDDPEFIKTTKLWNDLIGVD